MPERTRIFRTPPDPWITDSIKAVMRYRGNSCMKTETPCSVQDINLYIMLRNICTEIIRIENYHYFICITDYQKCEKFLLNVGCN